MMDLSAFPACSKRLEFQGALKDQAMNAYWAAVCIAGDFADDTLAKFGGFNFDLRTEANGYQLLGRLERLIKSGNRSKKVKSDVNGVSAAQESVRATLGAFGVKTSKLNGFNDYWTAAMVLWPTHISPSDKDQTMETLRFQIGRIPKKQRAKARGRIVGLPVTWRATQ